MKYLKLRLTWHQRLFKTRLEIQHHSTGIGQVVRKFIRNEWNFYEAMLMVAERSEQRLVDEFCVKARI